MSTSINAFYGAIANVTPAPEPTAADCCADPTCPPGCSDACPPDCKPAKASCCPDEDCCLAAKPAAKKFTYPPCLFCPGW
jgi:hypothetical protein